MSTTTLSTSELYSEEDSALIHKLLNISKVNPKLIRSSTYQVSEDPAIQVRSWRMSEFRYYDIPSPFPTLARGLFTTEVTSADSADDRYRIVARGYDKFYNIGEVPWTTWPAIKAYTTAPYLLSVKANGCIIFIAALTPTKLLFCSKHSIGPVQGSELSHAQAGEQWMKKYLEQKGRTEADLAKRLWDNQWTAISELCDDSFEEHVLPYPPERTGLHLHGLNVTHKHFTTQPQDVVDAFADEWGFIKTHSVVVTTVEEVQDFANKCAENGEWNGEAIEGFVVRTNVSLAVGDVTPAPVEGEEEVEAPPTKGKGKGKKSTATILPPPYPAGSTFFFKIKFDEPYMMYRDWREITKMLHSKYMKNPGVPLSLSSISEKRMRRKETNVYAHWVKQEIERDATQFNNFNKGKGIIATRERFLEWLKNEEGVGAISQLEAVEKQQEEGELKFTKTIIFPVAIPGCGKTTVARALVHLFNFGHTQSDDVKGKKRGPAFIGNVASLLQNYDVVIADKNNHEGTHRADLRKLAEDFKPSSPDFSVSRKRTIRLVALDWSHAVNAREPDDTHRIVSQRILNRGDNHQTLKADKDGQTHEEAIWMFMRNLEELSIAGPGTAGEVGGGDDGIIYGAVGEGSEADVCIKMELEEEDVDGSIRKAIRGVVKVLNLEMPTEERIAEAIKDAYSYIVPTMKQKMPMQEGEEGEAEEQAKSKKGSKKDKAKQVQPPKAKKKNKPPRYYGFLPEKRLAGDLAEAFSSASEPAEALARARGFYELLSNSKRVTDTFHATIVHTREVTGYTSAGGVLDGTPPLGSPTYLWSQCADIDGLRENQHKFRLTLKHIVWNERVMALTVDDVTLEESEHEVEETKAKAQEFIRTLPEETKQRLHITVGTADSKIPPVEAGIMVKEWRSRGAALGIGESFGNGGAVNVIEFPGDGIVALARVKGLFS